MRDKIETIQLKDGRHLEITYLTYPIGPEDQLASIALWRTAWKKTELNWTDAMNGDYRDSLTIRSVVGRIDGGAAGTTTLYHSRQCPEVSLVAAVVTHPDYRKQGIARRLTDAVVELGFEAGCRVAYLSGRTGPQCVYLHCGFTHLNESFMRCAADNDSDCEKEFFEPGQSTTIRPANWGDLPGTACLAAQPVETLVLDYPRCLLSGRYSPLHLCVSVFPNVWYEVSARGGAMVMLIGARPHRVLGFGSLTPHPKSGCDHVAVIDFAVHDNYQHRAGDLLDELIGAARDHKISALQAYAAALDTRKEDLLKHAGFHPIARLPGQLRVNNEDIDVSIWDCRSHRTTNHF